MVAAASFPCLIRVGHWNAEAAVAVSARLMAAAVTAMRFVIVSPPSEPGWPSRSLTYAVALRFPFLRRDLRWGQGGSRNGRVEVIEDALGQLRCDLGHSRQLGHRGLPHSSGGAQRLQQAGPNGGSDAGNPVQDRLDGSTAPKLLVVRDGKPVGLVAH